MILSILLFYATLYVEYSFIHKYTFYLLFIKIILINIYQSTYKDCV